MNGSSDARALKVHFKQPIKAKLFTVFIIQLDFPVLSS